MPVTPDNSKSAFSGMTASEHQLIEECSTALHEIGRTLHCTCHRLTAHLSPDHPLSKAFEELHQSFTFASTLVMWGLRLSSLNTETKDVSLGLSRLTDWPPPPLTPSPSTPLTQGPTHWFQIKSPDDKVWFWNPDLSRWEQPGDSHTD